jgi:hypothetical protein
LADGHSTSRAREDAKQVKKEIDDLFELQHKALEAATYLGMTPDQAKQIEGRRRKITALVDQLAQLKTRK